MPSEMPSDVIDAPRIVVFDPDFTLIDQLRSHLHVPCVTFAQGNGPAITKTHELDAMWVTPMQAEQLGFKPPFPLYRAQICDMPQAQILIGLPRAIVIGVAISPADPANHEWQLELIVSAMLTEVKASWNDGRRIEKLGITASHLLLDQVPPERAAGIIDRTYRKYFGERQKQ